jgi:hypothetical protein
MVLLAALSLPLILPMHRILASYEFERSERLVELLSAKPGDFLTAPGSALLPGGLESRSGSRRRLPGWLNCAAAVVAVVLCEEDADALSLFWWHLPRWRSCCHWALDW